MGDLVEIVVVGDVELVHHLEHVAREVLEIEVEIVANVAGMTKVNKTTIVFVQRTVEEEECYANTNPCTALWIIEMLDYRDTEIFAGGDFNSFYK